MQCSSISELQECRYADYPVVKEHFPQLEMWADAQRDGRPAEYR